MPILEYNNLSNSDEDWYCRTCTLPNFSDSYFDHHKSFDGTSDHEISYTGNLSNVNINIDTRELIQDDGLTNWRQEATRSNMKQALPGKARKDNHLDILG